MTSATVQPKADQSQVELARRMLRQMLLIRRFEEKAAEAYALGKIGGFCHLYIGQEAVAVGSLAALRHDDYVISSYREHGQALVRGVSAKAAMAELYGKATGCSKGKGGSMHLFDAAKRFMGGHGIVGGHVPLAAERARQGGHPTLLEVRTYRFMGHSMSDPLHGVYRTKDEVEEQKKRDPISQLTAKLKEDGALDQAGVDALDAEVRAEVEEAVKFADESPDPEPAELFTHVLTD